MPAARMASRMVPLPDASTPMCMRPTLADRRSRPVRRRRGLSCNARPVEHPTDDFDQARAAMVAQLRARGRSPRALEAVAQVRRELFVPWFFSFPPGVRFGGKQDVREWRVDG